MFFIFGEDFDKNKKHIKELIGYLGHESLYPVDFTLEDIKSSISIFYKNWDERLFNKYIEDFNLNLNGTYKELSKGQKVKFDLAMILSYHPKLIILDEPTANLDPLFRGEFLEILQLQMEKDLSTVISCDSILLLEIPLKPNSFSFICKNTPFVSLFNNSFLPFTIT